MAAPTPAQTRGLRFRWAALHGLASSWPNNTSRSAVAERRAREWLDATTDGGPTPSHKVAAGADEPAP